MQSVYLSWFTGHWLHFSLFSCHSSISPIDDDDGDDDDNDDDDDSDDIDGDGDNENVNQMIGIIASNQQAYPNHEWTISKYFPFLLRIVHLIARREDVAGF